MPYLRRSFFAKEPYNSFKSILRLISFCWTSRHTYKWLLICVWVTWLTHMCDMTRSDQRCSWSPSVVSYDTHTNECRSTTYQLCSWCVWHDSFICATWLVRIDFAVDLLLLWVTTVVRYCCELREGLLLWVTRRSSVVSWEKFFCCELHLKQYVCHVCVCCELRRHLSFVCVSFVCVCCELRRHLCVCCELRRHLSFVCVSFVCVCCELRRHSCVCCELRRHLYVCPLYVCVVSYDGICMCVLCMCVLWVTTHIQTTVDLPTTEYAVV